MQFTHGPKRDPKDFPFPLEVKRQPHFLRLHNNHKHVAKSGEEFHAITHDMAIKHLVANLDNRPAFDAIACALGSSGCVIMEQLIRAGERDPAKIFEMTQNEHVIEDVDGTPHLRLRYDFLYLHSRDHQRALEQSESNEGVKGGKYSVEHMKAMNAFTQDIGLEVNHARIKAETCKNCNK